MSDSNGSPASSPAASAPKHVAASVPQAAVTARSQAQALVAAVQTTIVPASTTAATAASAAAALSPLDSYEDGSFDPDLGEDDFDPGNANLDDSEWSNVQQNGAAAVTNFPGPPIVSPTFWAPPAHPLFFSTLAMTLALGYSLFMFFLDFLWTDYVVHRRRPMVGSAMLPWDAHQRVTRDESFQEHLQRLQLHQSVLHLRLAYLHHPYPL